MLKIFLNKREYPHNLSLHTKSRQTKTWIRPERVYNAPMRILAVDPGEKRIGLAISDPTGTIASPLTVLQHISRDENANTIVQIANERGAEKIIIGQALGSDGESTLSSRQARRLAGALREKTSLPVELWDETGSTQTARTSRLAMGVSRKNRGGHLDEIAATVILQSYLEHLRGEDY